MTTILDLLKTIYNATISLPIKQKINPNFNTKPLNIGQYYGGEKPYFETIEKTTSFDYIFSNQLTTKFKYKIETYKVDSKKFLGFTTKNERYLLKVRIYDNEKYNNSFNNEYFFDSEVNKTDLLKELFNFLINRNIELKDTEKSDKLAIYVNDLNQIVNKSVMREETLNRILSENQNE